MTNTPRTTRIAGRLATAAMWVTTAVLGLTAAASGAEPPGDAAAGQPVSRTVPDHGSATIRACSFPARIEWDTVHEFRSWFDRDGNQWMGNHHIRGTWTFTNLATGYQLESRDAALARAYDVVRDFTYDADGRPTGTVSWMRSNQGLHVPLNVPGDGRVLYDVGRLTFRIWMGVVDGIYGVRHTEQLTEAGQWSYWGLPDLCPYLDR